MRLHGLKKRGVGGGAAPPFANSMLACRFQDSYALKQACTAQKSRGVGGGRSPPHLQTQCLHERFICFGTSWHGFKSGGVGGGGGAQPPHFILYAMYCMLYKYIYNM